MEKYTREDIGEFCGDEYKEFIIDLIDSGYDFDTDYQMVNIIKNDNVELFKILESK